MARPLKDGIDYFPLDVSFLKDIKIRKILRACGAQSIAVLINLLCNIYQDQGYYMRWDDDTGFLIADDIGVKESYVHEVVKKAIGVDFFDNNLFNKFNILTSIGIQKRFLEATSRRKDIQLKNEYSLVNVYNNPVNVYNNPVNVDNNPVNVYKSTQSKVKESKVKESKGEESKKEKPPLAEKNNSNPESEEIEKAFTSLKGKPLNIKDYMTIEETLKDFSKDEILSFISQLMDRGSPINSFAYVKAGLESNREQAKAYKTNRKKGKTKPKNVYHDERYTKEERRAMIKKKLKLSRSD